ncbi:hypothetical protein [Endozoicomonas sp. ONNA2]|uniref:hypothetical protein n=1 Tax=Endozoicomonas sp. ONNA2 TaxID=2828741 RepID=UPI002148F5B2|nr:hypothetical protein [Endozoicomonas sp. ONNA2]
MLTCRDIGQMSGQLQDDPKERHASTTFLQTLPARPLPEKLEPLVLLRAAAFSRTE